jgi:hypothetical protein
MEGVPLPSIRAGGGGIKWETTVSKKEIPESIRAKFDCQYDNGKYRLTCQECGAKWSHPDKPMAIGTILHLLNHAASHE